MNRHIPEAPRCTKISRLVAQSAALAASLAFFLGACGDRSKPEEKVVAQSPAPVAQKPQSELAQMFSAGTDVLLSVNTAEKFGEVKPYNDVVLTVEPNGLKITAQGPDPAVLLPSFPGAEAIVEVILDSPADTTFQLFYRLPEMANYVQSDSITVPIKAGKNTIYTQIPMVIGALRLDPGMVRGEYLLESVQIKRVTVPNRIP